MRIRTAGVVAVATLSLLVAACGSNGSAKPSSSGTAKAAGGTLVIWADDQRAAALKPFADKFGKDNGVTVQVQAISKDLQTNFVTASQSGKGPDIVVGAHDWIGNLVQNGAIDPVQLTDSQKAAFADVAVQAVIVQRPDLRRALRDRERRADPQHRPGPERPDLDRGPGQARARR